MTYETINLKKPIERINQPFNGFDSIDPRMSRVPNDLNDKSIRDEYLENHVKWFLKNHDDQLDNFKLEVKKKYGQKIRKEYNQLKTIFD